MSSDLFGASPRERLGAAAALTPAEREQHLAQLAATAPYKPWPFGMPTSINPLLLVLGVSPGASPASGDEGYLTRASYPPPTFGEAHPGLYYPDTKNYWSKIRRLASAFVRSWDPTLSEAEALALSGHLNLGTGSFGSAGAAAVESKVVEWLGTAFDQLRPRTVIGVGLVGLLVGANGAPLRERLAAGGLELIASPRAVGSSVNGHAYSFRAWPMRTRGGQAPELVLWANHPSQAPFGGPGLAGSRWDESIQAALRELAK